jgi:hypothetical protein
LRRGHDIERQCACACSHLLSWSTSRVLARSCIYQEGINGLGDLEYPIDKQGDKNAFKLNPKGSIQVFLRALWKSRIEQQRSPCLHRHSTSEEELGVTGKDVSIIFKLCRVPPCCRTTTMPRGSVVNSIHDKTSLSQPYRRRCIVVFKLQKFFPYYFARQMLLEYPETLEGVADSLWASLKYFFQLLADKQHWDISEPSLDLLWSDQQTFGPLLVMQCMSVEQYQTLTLRLSEPTQNFRRERQR